MTKTTLSATLVGIAFAVTASAAQASSSQDALALCRAAIADEPVLAAYDADYELKSISGARTKKATFRMRHDGGRETVQCSVRRGEVVDLAWTGGGDALAALD